MHMKYNSKYSYVFYLVENVSEVDFVTAHNNLESTDTFQTAYNFCHDKAC